MTLGSSLTSKCSSIQLLLQMNGTKNTYFLQQMVFLYSSCVALTRKLSILRQISV